jgi:hypothetical protein
MLFVEVMRYGNIFSYLIAIYIGLVRFKHILKSYRPFIFWLCLAFTSELISRIVIVTGHSNAIIGNIYVLLEFPLILWLFKNWGIHQRKNKFYFILLIAGVGVWTWDSLINHPITHFSSIYRIFYSFVIIFLSIDQINYIITTERKNILRNSRFLICSSWLIFFTYKAVMESFLLFELNLSKQFWGNFFTIFRILILSLNLVYAVATLWIPTKQRFTQPY